MQKQVADFALMKKDLLTGNLSEKSTKELRGDFTDASKKSPLIKLKFFLREGQGP